MFWWLFIGLILFGLIGAFVIPILINRQRKYLYDFDYFTATVPGEGSETTLKEENWKKEEGFDILPLEEVKITKFSNSTFHNYKKKVSESNNGVTKTSYYQDELIGSEVNVYYIPFESEEKNLENRRNIENYFNSRNSGYDAYASYYYKNVSIIIEAKAMGNFPRDRFVKKFKETIQLK